MDHQARQIAIATRLRIVSRLQAAEYAALLYDFLSQALPLACGTPLVVFLPKHLHL